VANDPTWSLSLPFDTDDPEFARGVEVGIVWEKLDRLAFTDSHTTTVHSANTEMMLRIAEATGRPVASEDVDAEWTHVTFGPVAGHGD
jgi:hypothetical protein